MWVYESFEEDRCGRGCYKGDVWYVNDGTLLVIISENRELWKERCSDPTGWPVRVMTPDGRIVYTRRDNLLEL